MDKLYNFLCNIGSFRHRIRRQNLHSLKQEPYFVQDNYFNRRIQIMVGVHYCE